MATSTSLVGDLKLGCEVAVREPLVQVRDVTKKFRVRTGVGTEENMTALESVNFGIAEGELVSLLGASGCGKTTLLRIVAGLISPDEGVVIVDGAPVHAP